MQAIAGWVAPAATMIAAMMTAANFGARTTGTGFIVFTIGSLAWCVVALSSGQANLLWTNAFLTLVNAVGVWRWLGRNARFEAGSRKAQAASAEAPAPTLVGLGSLMGAKLVGEDGEPIGTIVDGMMRCADGRLDYVVVTDGGVAGLGEQLFSVSATDLTLGPDQISTSCSLASLRANAAIKPDAWPAKSPCPQSGAAA